MDVYRLIPGCFENRRDSFLKYLKINCCDEEQKSSIMKTIVIKARKNAMQVMLQLQEESFFI